MVKNANTRSSSYGVHDVGVALSCGCGCAPTSGRFGVAPAWPAGTPSGLGSAADGHHGLCLSRVPSLSVFRRCVHPIKRFGILAARSPAFVVMV